MVYETTETHPNYRAGLIVKWDEEFSCYIIDIVTENSGWNEVVSNESFNIWLTNGWIHEKN